MTAWSTFDARRGSAATNRRSNGSGWDGRGCRKQEETAPGIGVDTAGTGGWSEACCLGHDGLNSLTIVTNKRGAVTAMTSITSAKDCCGGCLQCASHGITRTQAGEVLARKRRCRDRSSAGGPSCFA